MQYPRGFLLKLGFFSIGLIAPLFVITYLKWPINTDLMVYAVALKAFSAQFWSGDIYPRWLMDTNAGMGSPMFLFYGPLPFYIGALLEPFAKLDPNGYSRLYATFIPAIFVSGLTCYRWLSLHFEQKRAAEGALIYATFPYVILCIYASFGLAHIWAIVLLPFALEGACLLARGNFSGAWKLCAAYALIALTHLPTTLVFAIVPCCYVFATSDKEKCWRNLMLALLAGMLGAMVAAVYLLPAMANRPFVTNEHFLDGQLIYYRNFYHIRFGLGLFLIFLPLLGFFIELPKSIRRKQPPHVRFWLIMCGALLLMTTQLSLPLWHALAPLQHLQFPFRFFTAMLPGAVFIAVSWLPYAKSKEFYGFFSLVCFGFIAYFSYNDYFWITDKYNRHVNEHNIIIAPEYRTPWTEKAGFNNPRELPPPYTGLPPTKIAQGNGQAEILSQSPRQIHLRADIRSASALVDIKRFYFPGWQANGNDVQIKENKALLAVELPKGKHDITLSQPWFAGEKEGLMISLIGLLGLICLWRKSKTQKHHV